MEAGVEPEQRGRRLRSTASEMPSVTWGSAFDRAI
jgi:hypothetical protein